MDYADFFFIKTKTTNTLVVIFIIIMAPLMVATIVILYMGLMEIIKNFRSWEN